jgi:ribonuclease BN (tRNA processing enzyme)
MRPTFRPELVNPAFGDPGLFVDFLHERRAVLFDLGDLRALAPRKLLRTTHVFVSHMHMDHFFGFDWLLHISLGRPNAIELFGPPGIRAQVEAKLSAYTWNLVANYAGNFTLMVSELQPDGGIERARYACRRCFAREPLSPGHCADGVLAADASFRVRATFLDHAVPVLGFALEEPAHVNVWRNRLEEKCGLAFDADERLQPRHLAREVRSVSRIDHRRNVFIGIRRFLGNAAHRLALDQNAARGKRLASAQLIAARIAPRYASPTCEVIGAQASSRSGRRIP